MATNPYEVKLDNNLPETMNTSQWHSANAWGGSRSLYLINKTNKTFIMMDRTNVPVVYPAPNGNFMGDNEIVVCHRYEWQSNEAISATFAIVTEMIKNEPRSSHNEDLFLVNETLTKAISANPYVGDISCTVTRKYPISLFSGQYSCRYIPESDLLLETSFNKHRSFHPESAQGRLYYKNNATEASTAACSLRIEIDLVDNDNHHSSKFVYFGSQVMEIAPIADPTRQNGIHLLQTSNANGSPIVKTGHLNMDEAKKILGICDTKDQALSSQDKVSVINKETELELARLKNSEAVLKQKASQDSEMHNQRMHQIEEAALIEKAKREAYAQEQKLAQEQAIADIKLKYEYEMNALKMKVEEAKASNISATQQTATTKSVIDEVAITREAVNTELAAARKAYYDGLDRNATLSATVVKYAPAVLAGAGAAILLKNMLNSNVSSVSDNW